MLYQNPSEYTTLSPSALKLLLERDDEEAERTRARLLARMGLSEPDSLHSRLERRLLMVGLAAIV